jgi:hypothetical protein
MKEKELPNNKLKTFLEYREKQSVNGQELFGKKIDYLQA